MGVPLVIIHFNGIFPYKPSIWGYPHYWKPICICIYIHIYTQRRIITQNVFWEKKNTNVVGALLTLGDLERAPNLTLRTSKLILNHTVPCRSLTHLEHPPYIVLHNIVQCIQNMSIYGYVVLLLYYIHHNFNWSPGSLRKDSQRKPGGQPTIFVGQITMATVPQYVHLHPSSAP